MSSKIRLPLKMSAGFTYPIGGARLFVEVRFFLLSDQAFPPFSYCGRRNSGLSCRSPGCVATPNLSLRQVDGEFPILISTESFHVFFGAAAGC